MVHLMDRTGTLFLVLYFVSFLFFFRLHLGNELFYFNMLVSSLLAMLA